jgi:hypothetical protein
VRLPFAPWNLFDHDRAAPATVHAPHGVEKEHEKPPQRNEFEAPLNELILSGSRLVAARADCGRTLARAHQNFDTLFVRTKACVLVDKASMPVTSVQNRDQFHGAEMSGGENI